MFNGRTGGAMWVPPEHRRPGPDDGAANTAIGHFRDKLLKLRDAMNTATARGLAAERHEFMELYLQRFYDEWYLS